jgi:rod shape-determining protein MreD
MLQLAGIWLAQVVVLNEVELFSFINPYVYPIIVLMLPVETKRAAVLIAAFVLGFSIDLMEQSSGIHAFACSWVGFLRPRLVRLVSTQKGFEFGALSLRDMGWQKFLFYAFSGLWIHHYFLFVVDEHSLSGWFFHLLDATYTSIFSLLIIFTVQLLASRKPPVSL